MTKEEAAAAYEHANQQFSKLEGTFSDWNICEEAFLAGVAWRDANPKEEDVNNKQKGE